MAELPILYSFRRCPYAMRARLALVVSKTSCVLREVALSNKPAELIAASPKATVPVLVLPSGEVIEQSLDIMRWSLGRNDPEDWLGADEIETDALIAVNDGPFIQHLGYYKYSERYDSDPIEHRDSCYQMVAALEARLAIHANLCRDTRSLADAALVPFVRQFAKVDPPWFDAQPLPNLRRWLALHQESSLFEAAALRVEPWQAGDPDTLFPAAPSL